MNIDERNNKLFKLTEVCLFSVIQQSLQRKKRKNFIPCTHFIHCTIEAMNYYKDCYHK